MSDVIKLYVTTLNGSIHEVTMSPTQTVKELIQKTPFGREACTPVFSQRWQWDSSLISLGLCDGDVLHVLLGLNPSFRKFADPSCYLQKVFECTKEFQYERGMCTKIDVHPTLNYVIVSTNPESSLRCSTFDIWKLENNELIFCGNRRFGNDTSKIAHISARGAIMHIREKNGRYVKHKNSFWDVSSKDFNEWHCISDSPILIDEQRRDPFSLSPDGKVACFRSNNEFHIVDTHSGTVVRTVQSRYAETAVNLYFYPWDTTKILVVNRNSVFTWSLDTDTFDANLINVLNETVGSFEAFPFTDGFVVIKKSKLYLPFMVDLMIYNCEWTQCVTNTKLHDNWFNRCRISPDAEILITPYGNHSFLVVNVETGEVVQHGGEGKDDVGNENSFFTTAFLPTGQFLFAKVEESGNYTNKYDLQIIDCFVI